MLRSRSFLPRSLGLAALLLTASVPTPAFAQGRYNDCLARVEFDPDGAFDEAMAWADMGGGLPARHCGGLALIALGHYRQAAERLEALAAEPGSDAATRAALLSQAGNAWLLESDAQRAFNALTQGLALVPDDTESRLDRARASALAEDFAAAKDDLDLVLADRPDWADALVLRANVQRALGDLTTARADAERAVALAPDNPAALIERGIVRHFAGDREGAVTDWRLALSLAPDAKTSADARALLERDALGIGLEANVPDPEPDADAP